jgi:hypothetical protein
VPAGAGAGPPEAEVEVEGWFLDGGPAAVGSPAVT